MNTETSPTQSRNQEAPPPARYRLGEVGKLVADRLERLQRGYLADKAPARASVAQLRQNVGRDPGADPAIWPLTSYPVPSGAPDAPTREEWAVHIVMTLYATHQQGRTRPAYVPGTPLGASVRRASNTSSSEALWQRFTAALIASNIRHCREHLRALVGQLHSNIDFQPVDYAALADDLVTLQTAEGATQARLRWERDYYAVFDRTTKTSDAAPADAPPADEE